MKIEYYVYQLIEPDGNVFYVGKGQKLRMYKHVRDVKAGRIPCNNYELGEQIWKIVDVGQKVKYKRVLRTYNEQEAYNYEKKVIKEIGLSNLCNKTSGGNGGYKVSEETRQKMSEAMKGNQHHLGIKHSEETKLKMSKSAKGNKNASNRKGAIHSEKTRKKMSESQKRRWSKKK